MVGKDKGKQGAVSHVIRDSNSVFVDGLHTVSFTYITLLYPVTESKMHSFDLGCEVISKNGDPFISFAQMHMRVLCVFHRGRNYMNASSTVTFILVAVLLFLSSFHMLALKDLLLPRDIRQLIVLVVGISIWVNSLYVVQFYFYIPQDITEH